VKLYDFFTQIENHKEYASRNLILNAKPIIENIELISECNLNCRMCIPRPKRKQKMMSVNQLKSIVDRNLSILKGEYVWLHHFGEPLLHPDLSEIISYLSSNGINSRLSTNCMLLNPEISENLIKTGLKEIVFSVDGMDENKFNYLRRRADYNLVASNVMNFLKLKQKMNSKIPVTQVQYVNIDGSKLDVERYINFWSKTSVNWINIKKPSTRANCVQDKRIMEKIYKQLKLKEGYKRRFPCYWLWSSLIVLSDGDVVPCCTDLAGKNIVGNALQQDLRAIWNSEKMQQFRRDQVDGRFELTALCKDCPEIRYYNCSFEEKLNEEKMKKKKFKEGLRFNHHLFIKNCDEN